MTGGAEFVVLSKSGQGHVLIDGSYHAYEGGAFYSYQNSVFSSQVGFFADSTTSAKWKGHLKPNADSSQDLGSSSLRWSNVYADTLYGNGANVTNVNATTLDSIDSGSFLRSDANDSASGTLNLNGKVVIGNSLTRPSALDSDADAHCRIGGSDVYLYVASLGAGGGYKVAMQAARASDFASFTLNLQSNGGNLERAGNKVWDAGNDGSGSGLDADTLDGVNSTSFLRSDADDTMSGLLTIVNDTGLRIYTSTNAAGATIKFSDQSTQAQNGTLTYKHSDGAVTSTGGNSNDGWLFEGTETRTVVKVVGDIEATGNMYASSGDTVFHTGNDGSGSGLDADTLDGVQGSSYLRSDANDTFTGNLTVNGIIYLADQIRIGDDVFIEDYNAANAFRVKGNQDSNKGFIAFGSQTKKLGCDGASAALTYDGNAVFHAGNDGGGSGLDADTLDGVQGASFLRSDANDTATGELTFSGGISTNGKDVYTNNGAVIANDSNGHFATRNGSNIDHLWHDDASANGMGGTWNFCSDTTYKAAGNSRVYAGFFSRAGNKVWDQGNDGSGSGLDSDLLDGQEGSYYRNASNLNAGTLPAARLGAASITESGISVVGNFGQWQGHSQYTNFNTEPAYWGWNFVQGNTNAPNTTSNQWYRCRLSLGSGYGKGSDSGDYSLEMALPRYNHSAAGVLHIRTIESGAEGSWTTVGSNASLITTGTLPAARLPNHSASLLTSGTIPAARLGALPATIGLNTTVGNLPASRNAFLALGDSDTGVAQNGDGQLELWANNQEIMNLDTGEIECYKHLRPNGSQDLGSSSARWQNLYVNDMHFSNEGKTNDVDGSWGDWTLQEGESDIFMINNRTGKKFKIAMIPV